MATRLSSVKGASASSSWRVALARPSSLGTGFELAKPDASLYSSLKPVLTGSELIELFLTAAAFEMFPRFIGGLRIPVIPPPSPEMTAATKPRKIR